MERKIQKYEEKQPEVVHERPWVSPRVDIYESNDEVLLLADLPGVNQSELQVHLEKDQLSIEGQVHEESLGDLLGREYPRRDYRRTFAVPAGIDRNKIRADLKHGVLELHLPKSEALRPRQVTVEAG